MTKDQEYKLLFENWLSFLKEETKEDTEEDEEQVNFRSQVNLADPIEKGSSWDALSDYVGDTYMMLKQKYLGSPDSSKGETDEYGLDYPIADQMTALNKDTREELKSCAKNYLHFGPGKKCRIKEPHKLPKQLRDFFYQSMKEEWEKAKNEAGDSQEDKTKLSIYSSNFQTFLEFLKKTPPRPKPEQKPGSNVSTLNISADNNHVKVALQQLKIFGNGKLKEKDDASWPHIADYWEKGAGDKNLARGTRGGRYKERGKGSFSDRARWSAAFIQYCMRGNAEFQKLKNGYGKGSHKRYWMAARENTKFLKKGTLPEKEWFYLTVKQFKEIGYTPQVGDIGMMMSNPTYGRGGLHGDIYTPQGKVGGNLSDSVRIQRKPTVSIVTQNPEARERFLKFHNVRDQNMV